MEARISARERAKNRLTIDEQQAEVLDILSSAPVRSVSFTFLAFMLTRIAAEIAPHSSLTASSLRSPRTSMSPPRASIADGDTSIPAIDQSPTRTFVFPPFRRRNRASISTSSQVDSENKFNPGNRRPIEHAFARIFAGLMIRSATSASTKEKDKKVAEDKKIAILEPFLHNST
jgi:hypothetical protein